MKRSLFRRCNHLFGFTVGRYEHATGSNGCHRLMFVYMGVDYLVIAFDMEVQPLVTHNAA